MKGKNKQKNTESKFQENLASYSMYGQNYVRSKPLEYRDRKSPAQLAQRQKLQVVNRFLKPFTGALKITFASEARGRSALQAAQSFNMRHGLEGTYPDIRINKTAALLSSGLLPLPAEAWLTCNNNNLLIEWDNYSETETPCKSDNLIVFALFEKDNIGIWQFTKATRSNKQFLWKHGFGAHTAQTPDVWICFSNENQNQVSRSMYVPMN